METTVPTQYIPPKGEYNTFLDDNHYKEKLKEWGLAAGKKEFWYKDRSYQCLVTIKGYENYGISSDYNTLVIEFPDGNLSCIQPAYLKEMQQSGFGKESVIELESTVTTPVRPESKTEQKTAKPEKAAAKPKKEKAPKLELPTDKVHFTASVKQFALTYNPFNEENDEVVVLENVQIDQESPLELGLAWCSHSKTLKKFELAPGDKLEFDGKVAPKKLAKGKDVAEEFTVDQPVAYKINNPSKITKK
ncbi:hypothetical protein [Neobacillus sp. LXY-1]|uniref:hypothetical protein n=1 Tax=Neobacillus sp. LXY-1 TaxID=3379133 RepID=UPI003EDF8696